MAVASGNILVQTNCLDFTMAWKTSCKDVARRWVVVHCIIFLLGCLGMPPLPERIRSVVDFIELQCGVFQTHCWRGGGTVTVSMKPRLRECTYYLPVIDSLTRSHLLSHDATHSAALPYSKSSVCPSVCL